ncbi:MAG: redoxin domain-containing protein, partial [Gammaproteobacteria bacterium]|nr:redoxin domain-containing protein [Gammaproteobacteria bacterium]
NTTFDLDDLQEKRCMLPFFRCAGYPFCNRQMHQLVSRYGELVSNFNILALFDSPLENLQRHSSQHTPPFTVLADTDNTCYHAFGIEHSLLGIIKGIVSRMPQLLYAVFFRGYKPFCIKGSLSTMPTGLLVDEQGIIHTAYYGQDGS